MKRHRCRKKELNKEVQSPDKAGFRQEKAHYLEGYSFEPISPPRHRSFPCSLFFTLDLDASLGGAFFLPLHPYFERDIDAAGRCQLS